MVCLKGREEEGGGGAGSDRRRWGGTFLLSHQRLGEGMMRVLGAGAGAVASISHGKTSLQHRRGGAGAAAAALLPPPQAMN
jgi:hypothetical protein